MGLTDRVALVTGASRGIGAVIAASLASHGAKVAVNYSRSAEAAESVVSSIREKGGQAQAYKADVAQSEAVGSMVEAVEQELGPVDILVHNASAPINFVSFAKTDWTSFEVHLDVGVRGGINCCKAVIPGMVERKYGRVINILTSILIGAPPAQWAPYVVAKMALWGLTKSLARWNLQERA
jgi:3-oxoacyl-[acyl-carrier protein] reductase